MKAPTLADVAEVVGVSPKTVSNVLLGQGRVSDETRERVQLAAQQLNYRPNQAGRGLSSGRTGRIALVVPVLYQPYFSEIAERTILELGRRGYSTTLRIAPDLEAERRGVFGLTTPDVDGVIVCPHARMGELLRGRVLPRPVVLLGGAPVDQLDCVVMGEWEGAYAVTRHLLQTGRRRIALIWNASPDGAPGGDRFDGFVAAMADAGVEPDPSLFVCGSDWDRRMSGYEAMVSLLRSGAPFDAALCINDALAVGAMRALRSHGRTIPGDVAVTGFDDTIEAQYTTPSLTSVNPQQGEMVEAAVTMLVERIDGYDGPARRVETGAELIVRESSAPTAAHTTR